MIPLADDSNGERGIPVVTWLLILVNIIVFIFVQDLGGNSDVAYAYSTVPQEILSGRDIESSARYVSDPLTKTRYTTPGLGSTPIPVYLTLITALFLHGGVAHLAGNMLYLFIFGDNLERRAGPVYFLIFYLFSGIIGGLAHVLVSWALGMDLLVPCLGASGAISGVLAAYVLLFPGNRVTVLVFRFFLRLRAAYVIGFWFLFQLINGIGLLGSGSRAGGVAYAAHIGGFIGGIVLLPLLSRNRAAKR